MPLRSKTFISLGVAAFFAVIAGVIALLVDLRSLCAQLNGGSVAVFPLRCTNDVTPYEDYFVAIHWNAVAFAVGCALLVGAIAFGVSLKLKRHS
jgi:hypothetical protein